MQIYANLFKINEKCHLSSIQKSQQICTSGGDVYYASRNLLSTCFSTYPVIAGRGCQVNCLAMPVIPLIAVHGKLGVGEPVAGLAHVHVERGDVAPPHVIPEFDARLRGLRLERRRDEASLVVRIQARGTCGVHEESLG